VSASRSAAWRRAADRRRASGFTILELIIVIAVIGILATIALPALRNLPRRANEAALKTNLRTMRDVIDQHYGDKGRYPPSLETLVEDGYLRGLPDDITGEPDTWVVVYESEVGEGDGFPEEFQDPLPGEEEQGVVDVRSGSDLVGMNGVPYSEW
jgi:general secretion pathway protein G